MANKETRILKNNTLEVLRQKSNEISLHLGDNEQLNALMADKTYIYSAAAGDILFAGSDTSSPAKTSRFEVSPAHTVDNTGGYIILEGVSTIGAFATVNGVIYQGSSGSPTWSGSIVSGSNDKILVRDTTGTFSTSSDLKTASSTIANAKVIRIVTEAYPVGVVRVYKNGTELTQGITANGFHVANIKATITQTGSPTLTNYTEGVTIYQGDSQSSQADIEANATWYGTLHSVSGGVIHVKTFNGSFSTSTLIRALSSSDTITGANHGALTVVDSTYGSYIQLITPAAGSDAIKIFSLDVVAAINELQDDIGTVESLTTAANDLVLAINEHDAELGTITAGAMGTAASTVSTAIAEHETQIGNVDITGISGSNDTITGALEQIHNEVGNVTSGNLGTSASNLTSAVREHEDQIGNENITSIDSGSNTITGALNQLHTEVGDLALHTTSADLTEAINELEEDLFNGEGATKRTRASLLTTDKTSIVDSINELHTELFDTGVSFTGLSADDFKSAVNELRVELGDHSTLDTNTDVSAVLAINELENVLRDDTTQRTGYVMGTNANNIIAAINEIETVLRAGNANYTLNTAAQNVRDAINEHESQIGNMVFGTGGPVDAANSTDLSGAVRVLDAEIGDTSYTGADLTTAIKNTQDDILTAGSLTTLNTDAKFIQGAINEIEGVFDASAYGISAGANSFDLVSGQFTLDSSADIVLNADSGNVILEDGLVQYAKFSNDGGQLIIYNGNSQMLVGNGGANALFQGTLDVDGNFEVGASKFNVTAATGNTQIDGTLNVDSTTTLNGTTVDGTFNVTGATELNSTLGVDGNFRVGSSDAHKFNVDAASGNTQVDGYLEVDGTAGVDGNFRVGSSGGDKFNVTAASGNTQIDGTLNVDSTTTLNGTTIDGNLDLNGSVDVSTNATIHGVLDVDGVSNLDVVDIDGAVDMASTLQVDGNTNIGGTLGVTGLLTGSALDISGNIDVDGITNLDVVDIDGAVNMATTLQVGGVGTFLDSASVAGNFSVNGNTTLGNQASDTVAIPGDLTITGNLTVNGTQTTLSTATLEVEDTLVLVGSDLGNAAEPSTGGFGLETRLFSGAANVTYNGRTWDATGKHPNAASNISGTHSIAYNFATDQWEADGSLILSSASLGSPDIKVNNGSSLGDLESSNSLDFIGTSGLTVVGAKVGTDYNITFTNTDKGSSQHIWKTITADSGSVAANSNSDSLAFTTGVDLTTSISGDSVVINHDTLGTAGTYGITGTQDGQYIKSIITNAQGHVTGVTSADFDTRYQATNPSFEIKVNNVKVDDVFPSDKIDLIEGVGIDISGTLSGTESNITISHQDTSSVSNLTQNNSSNTFIQDLAFTFDTFGHVTGASASTGTVAIGNGSFTVSGSSGLSGSGSMTANQSGNSSAGLTNTDKGSSQNIFKNIAVRNLGDTVLGTLVADNNNDTIYIDAGNSGITLTVDDVASDHFSINHADTSSANSVNNSGRTYIQDITLDTYGHITAISSATESYVYTPPTYAGDDINIDTGALTGATVISDLDFNVTTNTLGHVTDANATIATRNLTLSDLGFVGWDVEVNGVHQLDVGNNVDVDFKNGNHTTAVWTSVGNRIQWNHNTFTSGGTFVGGSDNGIVIEDFHIDSYGHVRSVGTRDLDSRYDNYYDWNLTADSGGTASITSNATVDIAGGNHISTVRSGNNVTVNFVDPGYLTSQKTATFAAVNSGSDSNDPILRHNDGSNNDVRFTDSGLVTVSYTNSGQINFHGASDNTDINVNDTNLRTRLAALNPAQGVVYIGDSGNDLDLRIRGNLRVEGTQTIMNTETVTTEDNIIVLNSNAASTPTESGGIELERGNQNNATLLWNESSDRWQHGIIGTLYNIPLPSESDITRFYAGSDSGTATITRDNTLGHVGGTAIETSVSGDNITFTHSNVSSTATTLGNTTLAHSGQFSVVSGVSVNSQGHVTQVNTKPFTLPAAPATPNTGLLDINAGSLIDLTITGGDFHADKSSETDIVINVDLTELVDMTQDVNGSQDEMVLLDNSVQKRKLISEITLSDFNNDLGNYGGFATSSGVTSVATGTGLSGGTITSTGTINLDVALSNQLGGVKIGFAESGKNYPVELNASQQAFVNVPWTDANDNTTFSHRVTQSGGSNANPYISLENSANSTDDNIQLTAGGITTVTRTSDDNITIETPGTNVTVTQTSGSDLVQINSSTGNDGVMLVASSAFAGLMDRGHHDKLDGIEAGATADQTTFSNIQAQQNGTNTVLHSADALSDIFTIDAGDGITIVNGTDKITIDLADNVQKDVKFNTSSTLTVPALYVDVSESRLGIGTNTPASGFNTAGSGGASTGRNGLTILNGSYGNTGGCSASASDLFITNESGPGITLGSPNNQDSHIFFSNTNDIADGRITYNNTNREFRFTTAGTLQAILQSDGDLHVENDIIAFSTTISSDAKLKTNIKTVENALDKVCQLDGVTFDWIKDGKESAGVIAQNVEEVLPRAVKEVEDLNGDDTHKVVDYNQLSALFIEAIKELKEENKLLKAEIESLKDINS